jgi:hypothetical protein
MSPSGQFQMPFDRGMLPERIPRHPGTRVLVFCTPLNQTSSHRVNGSVSHFGTMWKRRQQLDLFTVGSELHFAGKGTLKGITSVLCLSAASSFH